MIPVETLENKVVQDSKFDLHHTLHELKHYLPAQAPLKDFVHHNTLHAYQDKNFHLGTREAAEVFGYKVSLNFEEYRQKYAANEISIAAIEKVILENQNSGELELWKERMLNKVYENNPASKLGKLRHFWKTHYKIDLNTLVHGILFRILCNYLDQGISMWDFPVSSSSLIQAIREIEQNSYTSFFKRKRAKQLLLETECKIEDLLRILVGNNEGLYEQYLFDQQFAHQGWSGLVCSIEAQPSGLLDPKPISLHDIIVLECLLEIDALDSEHGKNWQPLESKIEKLPAPIFEPFVQEEYARVLMLWQEAMEWTYYDQVLTGLKYVNRPASAILKTPSFQALFCIDDRECSVRRYIESEDPNCETFGTPGFFSMEFYFQPEGGKFYTKLCPAPITPKYLIKEIGSTSKRKKDLHLSKNSHGLARGWLITQTLGFASAFRLLVNIFKPSISPAASSSFQHMDKVARLTIENTQPSHTQDGLQIGFTITEVADRVERMLRSIGMTKTFAPLIYVIGHGASSVNNPYYAAYDCGACCGRPGSVNARVFCHAANHIGVREILRARGIDIPASTQFLGGLHDTTRDEVLFYDEDTLSAANAAAHIENEKIFDRAMDSNAKERSRRLELINTAQKIEKVHDKIKARAVSLFEPRPELNHATNTLCIVGGRNLTRNLFLDRRAFLNSYNYKQDLKGEHLLGILNAAAPVCGGINLEYYFSRVDNQKLGAGSKLPHNVMGLIGVANGADGDLRPGLPSQMVEVHDPIRLMIIVEHFPEVVLSTIQRNPATYEWFNNEWVHLAIIHPETRELSRFKNGEFIQYQLMNDHLDKCLNIDELVEQSDANLPVLQLH